MRSMVPGLRFVFAVFSKSTGPFALQIADSITLQLFCTCTSRFHRQDSAQVGRVFQALDGEICRLRSNAVAFEIAASKTIDLGSTDE